MAVPSISWPALAMILVQVFATVMLLLSKLILEKGMNIFTLMAYRHLVAAITLAPFAFFCDKGTKLTIQAFGWIFVCSLFGITMGMGFYYYGLLYTSTTFAATFVNMVPVLTFLIAVIFRMEKLCLKTLGGRVKLAGTIFCVLGAMLATLYKGSSLKLFPSLSHIHQTSSGHFAKGNMTYGALMLVASSFSYSFWYVAQAKLVQSCKARYLGTTLMCLIASGQSAVLCFVLTRDLSMWKLGLDLNLVTIVYSGVFSSAATISIVSWCVGKRGPIYATMFNPLLLVLSCITGSLILGERLYIGSILGSIIIVGGLYSYLWGKNKESKATILPQGEEMSVHVVAVSASVEIVASSPEVHGVKKEQEVLCVTIEGKE